jgi:hypothetical protein
MNVVTYLEGARTLGWKPDSLYTEVFPARLAVTPERWLTRFDNSRRGLIQLPGLTQSTEGRDFMGPWMTTPTGDLTPQAVRL